MPGLGQGGPDGGAGSYDDAYDGWCYCDGQDDSWSWCKPPPNSPTQINVLIVNASAVAISFVTEDAATGKDQPRAEVRSAQGDARHFGGFTTTDATAAPRHHHHVLVSGLSERTNYTYRVAGPSGAWSTWLTFTSLYSSGVTRLAMYGDHGWHGTGHTYNPPGQAPALSFGNLLDDVRAGRIDAIIHCARGPRSHDTRRRRWLACGMS